MIFPMAKVTLPIARFPEPVAVHVVPTVAKGRVSVRSALQVEVVEFFEVGTNGLIGIDEDDFVDAQWKQDVQEEDLVSVCRCLNFINYYCC